MVAAPADTGLPDGSASVVYGEACLSLEGDSTKGRILAEPAKMLLLDPRQMLRDEGLGGTLRLGGRILRSRIALQRVTHLWRMMRRERRHLGSIAIVAVRSG